MNNFKFHLQLDPGLMDFLGSFPINIYLYKVNNRKSRKRCKTCLKSTIKTSEQCVDE